MPDSRSVYVLRLNRVQNRDELFIDRRRDGRGHVTIFKESDPYWINISSDVRFLKDGKHFLWTSERDGGSATSYLYSNDGREVRQLTKGAWEVRRHLRCGRADRPLYYTSSEAQSAGDAISTASA